MLFLRNQRIDFLFEFCGQLILRDLTQNLAVAEENTAFMGSGNADIRTLCFLHAVYRTAHDCNRNIGTDRAQIIFYLPDDRQHIILDASAGRAGNQIRLIFDQPKAVQQLFSDYEFILRRSGNGYADRISDSFVKQNTKRSGTLYGGTGKSAGFRYTKMERIRKCFRSGFICRNRQRDIAGLEGQADIMEVQFFKNIHMAPCTFNHRFGAGLSVFFQQAFLQRSGVDSDPDRDVAFLTAGDNRFGMGTVADVAGINADRIDSLIQTVQRKQVVEVNIGDDRYADAFLEGRNGAAVFFIQNRDSDDFTSMLCQFVDLCSTGGSIFDRHICH